ncbi:hypothetical protein [Bacillus wiedmannii]|uniref:hypothetical protein n=1 Tax=Bacillus wiedmannii TaxID=1890302 RepID=UPI00211D18FA|nr:hypothetical protein [Bacillus wiedmannii]
MAKLDGVKVVNENTVEYNGFVYGLVKGDIQVNDLVKASDYELDVTEGAFYLITGIDEDGDIEFYDDANDVNLFYKGHQPVFRKSHAITNDKLTDAEGVVKIELPDGTKLEGTPSDLEKITRSMQALQNEQVATVEMPEETVEVEVEGEAVLERLQVGEYAKVIEEGTHSSKVGDIVKIYKDDEDNQPFKCEDLQGKELRYPWFYERELVRATEAEVKAATEPKEEPLKVGDYAKVVKVDKFEVGDIVEIDGENSQHFRATRLNDGYWHYADLEGELVKATDEEVLEIKQALLKEGDFARVIANTSNHRFEIGTVVKLKSQNSTDSFTAYYLDESDFWGVYRDALEPLTAEEAEHIAREAEEEKKAKAEREEKEAGREKWAAIGREVGEIKKGDIVRTVSHCGSVNPVGTIGVAREDCKVSSCPTVALNGDSSNWSEVELIVPVEQRFDTVG